MQQQITFAEAFKLHEQGVLIESVETGRTFMKEWENDEDQEVRQSQSFDPAEIRGLWWVFESSGGSKLYKFLKAYITENYEGTTVEQVEATARGIEYYLTANVIPETLAQNKEETK